jgi:hypothetical protein
MPQSQNSTQGTASDLDVEAGVENVSEQFSERSSVRKPTDPDYESLLRDRGIIYDNTDSGGPKDLEEIERLICNERQSPGPDADACKRFPRRSRKSGNENGALQALLPQVLPIIDNLWDSPNDALPLNMAWDRQILLGPEMQPAITPPKPDQAFGFLPEAFPFKYAASALKSSMYPTRDLAWPYFTVEAKGRQGQLDVARLQNMHNGAIMLNNMLQLKRSIDREHELIDKVGVMTLELTTESISLSAHWIARNPDGTLHFRSRCVTCYSGMDPSGHSFRCARRDALNAIELFRTRTQAWVTKDMAILNENIVNIRKNTTAITPPTTQASRNNSRRRDDSRSRRRDDSRKRRSPPKTPLRGKSTLSNSENIG